jgi:VWFA-related protein
MYLYRVLLWLVLLLSTAASLRSQTAASDSSNAVATIKTKLQLVLVDVVVTNNKGEPVPSLRREDFEIFEDNKPQTISTFEEHRGVPLTQIKLPPMPPGVYTNYPLTEKADSVNVLLLDALNTQTGDQAYVRTQMIKYLATISPGARLAVFTLASRLRMLQGITTDSAQLLAVLNDKKGVAGVHQSPLLPSSAENEADQHTIDFLTTENGGHPPPQNGAQAAVDSVNALKQFMADAAAFQTESRVRVTLQALQQLARYLSDIPGRKNVIWFSSAFPVGILPDPDLPDPSSAVSAFQQEIRKTTNLLAASQVAIYPIAAEGLNPDAVYQATGAEIGEKRPSMANIDQIKQMRRGERDRDSDHTVMEDIAKDTGGQAFYNTNGLSDALTRVIDNGTRYYSLSYTPTDRNMDGRFRRIRLNLQGAKYRLAYRRGYYAENPGTEQAVAQKQGNDPLLPLVGRNLPDLSNIVYKVKALPLSPQPAPDAPRIGSGTELKGPVTRFGVDFAVAVQDLRLDPTPDGGRRGNIEVMLVAYDGEGKPVNLVVTQGELILKPAVYKSLLTVGLQMHKEIDLPKQAEYMRTGIYDLDSDAAGTLGFPLRPVNPSVAVSK